MLRGRHGLLPMVLGWLAIIAILAISFFIIYSGRVR